jgi:hypothetical protein
MYLIENKENEQWLTVGGNTTKDTTHPGLISFDNKEEAELTLLSLKTDNWRIIKIK